MKKQTYKINNKSIFRFLKINKLIINAIYKLKKSKKLKIYMKTKKITIQKLKKHTNFMTFLILIILMKTNVLMNLKTEKKLKRILI